MLFGLTPAAADGVVGATGVLPVVTLMVGVPDGAAALAIDHIVSNDEEQSAAEKRR